ncbi:MAG: GNAT family N-acetyltransferase [Proteobacteria bacterium]|nr:GNAT family N-acetyltransferase [Pseudomonadota bacterium]
MKPNIRPAQKGDVRLLLDLMNELAEHQGLRDEMVGTETRVLETLFCDNPKVEAILLEDGNDVIGFAIFFHNYSTFSCQHGLYIEDLYVRESYRERGFGKYLLSSLSDLALSRGCVQVELLCLDDNMLATGFYKKLGAHALDTWTVHKWTSTQMEQLASLTREQ